MTLSLPSFFAAAISAAMFAAVPLSGGAAAAPRPAARAAAGAERTVRPAAAAMLRFSICDRLIPSSSSLRQNSISCSSWSSTDPSLLERM